MRSKPRNTVYGHLPEPYFYAGDRTPYCDTVQCRRRLKWVRSLNVVGDGYWRHARRNEK